MQGAYDAGDDIARIPPELLTLGLEAKLSQLSIRGEVQMLGEQNNLAAFETPTASATTYNVALNWQPMAAEPGLMFMLEGRNLSDEDVREHTSFLKDQLPKPGRSVRLSLRARF